MDHQRTSTPIVVSDEQPNEANIRLHRRLLVFVRILCIVLVAYTLGYFGTIVVIAFMQHRAICTGLTCVLAIPEALVYFAVAALIFWRKSEDWMALLVALMLVLISPMGTLSGETLTLLFSIPIMHVLFGISNYLAFASLLLYWFLFPNGHFWPRWTPWLVVGYLLWGASYLLEPSIQPDALWSLNLLLFTSLLVTVILTQISRYNEVSGPVERQQTKWANVGTSIAVCGWFAGLGSTSPTLSSLFLLLIPLSIGIAVLRYRLFDIGVLINRALIYSALTGTLVLVYFGLIFALQFLLRGFIGQTNDLTIVISTLAVAALFQPLRHRIQLIIDWRFYRSKYDAARTLAAFSATLRNEVDLEQLREELVAVVQETMQPAHVSLWLRPPEHDGKHLAPWKANPPASSEGT